MNSRRIFEESVAFTSQIYKQFVYNANSLLTFCKLFYNLLIFRYELNDIIDAILFKCVKSRGYYQDIGVLADFVKAALNTMK